MLLAASAEVVERFKILPEERALAVIDAALPVVVPDAVNKKPLADAPEAVNDKTGLVASFEDIEATSLAVAGERVVTVLVQKPEVPEDEPVILPEQVRFPLVPSSVQPVSADPPDITIDPDAPVGPRLKVVAAPAIFKVVVVLLKRARVVWSETIVAAEPIVSELEPNIKLGSVAPASNVQVMPEPEPKLVVPISVVSRLRVIISVFVPIVSMPFVPPDTSRVLLSDIV